MGLNKALVGSKSELAIAISKLSTIENTKVRLEQYSTDSEIAAEVLWQAFLVGDTVGKVVVDLGCGTGTLGLGAFLVGAKKVYFVDLDEELVEKTIENLFFLEKEFDIKLKEKAVFLVEKIKNFTAEEKIDVVIQNPPFGTKQKHADKVFLEKAVEVAPVIYSFHKTSTRKFVEAFAADNGFEVTHCFNFAFPLKQTLRHHKAKIKRINVDCCRLKKMG